MDPEREPDSLITYARALRRRRYFRDRSNVFELYDDDALIRDYRFPKKNN
jgi:hypothetical protein